MMHSRFKSELLSFGEATTSSKHTRCCFFYYNGSWWIIHTLEVVLIKLCTSTGTDILNLGVVTDCSLQCKKQYVLRMCKRTLTMTMSQWKRCDLWEASKFVIKIEYCYNERRATVFLLHVLLQDLIKLSYKIHSIVEGAFNYNTWYNWSA